MGDHAQVCRGDLNTRGLQSELYDPEGDSDGSKEFESRFIFSHRRSSPISGIDLSFCSQQEDSQTMVYRMPDKVDAVLSSTIEATLPPLIVREQYRDTIRICWPLLIGNRIIERGECKIGTSVCQIITPTILDIYFHHMIPNDEKEFYGSRLGLTPLLTDWNTCLPGYNLVIPQPWFYCQENQKIANVKMINTPLTHRYIFTKELEHLVRMQSLDQDTGEWRDISYSPDYLVGIPHGADIKDIKLMGRFAMITEEEKLWLQGESSTLFYQTLEEVEDLVSETISLGKTRAVRLDTPSPITDIHIVAENTNALVNHNYSNYTTCSTNVMSGWNPVQSVSLYYGNSSTRVPPTPSSTLDYLHPLRVSKGKPIHPGYNLLSFRNNRSDSKILGDTIIADKNNAILKIQLGDTNPYLMKLPYRTPDVATSSSATIIPSLQSTDEFKVHVILNVFRKLSIGTTGSVTVHVGPIAD